MCGASGSENLVARATSGDTVALKVLLTTAHGGMRRVVERRMPKDLSRVVDPDDVVQEAQIEVFRRIDTFEFRGPHSFTRWTTAVVLSRLRNAIKRHRALKRSGTAFAGTWYDRRIEDSSIALFETLAAPGKTPSRSYARIEAVGAVKTALEQLPLRWRLAVCLVHLEGRPIENVARTMGCTQRAVHGLCRRGLKQLGEELKDSRRFLSSTG